MPRCPCWRGTAKEVAALAGMLLLAEGPALRVAGQTTGEVQVTRPARALSQYAFDRWDDRQGLQQPAIQAIAQTRDGYLWLGSQDGLIRFDGNQFKLYNGATHPELKSAYFWALTADRDGGLWGGTEFAGAFYMKSGRITKYGVEQGLPGNWVRTLLQDRTGVVWIGTTKGLARVRDGRLEVVHDTAVEERYIRSLAEDSAGRIWVSTSHGVGIYAARGYEAVRDAQAKPLESHKLLASRRGGMWLYNGGKVEYYGADGISGPRTDVGKIGIVWTMEEDDRGDLWIGGTSGIGRLSGGRFEIMSRDRGPAGEVMALYTDREGSLWGGSFGDGLLRLRNTPIVPVGPPEGMSGKATSGVLYDRAGVLWIGTWGNGVNRIENGSMTVLSEASGQLTHDIVFDIAETRDSAIWIGANTGVSRTWHGQTQRFGAKELPVQVRAIVEDSAGRLWLGTNKGIRTFGQPNELSYGKADGLAGEMVLDMLATRDGSLWIGTMTGLSRMAGGRIETFDAPAGPPREAVAALYEGSDGVLWMASTTGLVRYDEGRFFTYTTALGLCDGGIGSIIEDGHGRLWLGGANGIFHVKRTDLDAVAAGKLPKLVCRIYDRADGMRNRETQGNAARSRDGRLWFPTLNGVAVADPNDADSNLGVPPVLIEEVIANGQRFEGDRLEIPAGNRNLSIRYTAPSYVGTEKIRFRYRLQGLDEAWVDAGNRRTAFYTNVPPGTYAFRVLAANADGEWNEIGARLELRVLPFLYQNLWFRAGAGLALAAALFLLFRWRIAELRARLDKHRRAELQYRDAFERTSDAIIVTDLQGRITNLNVAAERLIGFGAAEANARHVNDFIVAIADQDASNAAFSDTGVKPLQLRARDGTGIPVDVSTHVVDFGSGPIGIQLIARDLRERNQLEQQLRQSQKMEAVGHLAGGVAHDFNNLLTVIRGNSELLLEQPGSVRTRADLQQIVDAAERAAKLTQQLLMFGKKEIVLPRTIDLNAVVSGMEPMLRRLIRADITISCTFAPQPTLIHADRGHVEQVLMNLALNARDAMPDGGTLQIDTSLEKPHGTLPAQRNVLLTVSDTGTGMSEATLRQIYDPFFTTKEQGKGTGLGLSTVYGIIAQSGGSIDCVSSLGAGSTFRVLLPYHADGAYQPAEPAAACDSHTAAATILLAEDEAGVRSLVSRVLRRQGYHVIEARHGKDALELAARWEQHIDLLLTDMMMPELDGRALFRQLSVIRPETPVLFMSGYTTDEMVRQGLLVDGEAFIGKPFTPDELANAVREVLLQPKTTRGGTTPTKAVA